MLPHFIEAGAGAPIVFLHGWTMDSTIFVDQMTRLRDTYYCVAPDLPGHGQSRDLTPTITRAAESLDALLTAKDLKGVTLVAWSMGALVAWRYIARFGMGRIAGLVTVDMSPKLLNGPSWSLGLMRQTRRAAAHPEVTPTWPERAEVIAQTMFASETGPDLFPVHAAKMKILSQNEGMMRTMWASMMKADARDVVRQVTCPWLVCYGTHSQIYPQELRPWLLKTAPNARALGFSDSGHTPHLEEPRAFAQAIGRFASELQPQAD